MTDPLNPPPVPEGRHEEIITEGSKTAACNEALEAVDAYIAMNPGSAGSGLNKVHNALTFLHPFCVMADTDVSVTVAPPAPPPARSGLEDPEVVKLLAAIGTATQTVLEQLQDVHDNPPYSALVETDGKFADQIAEIITNAVGIRALCAPDLVQRDQAAQSTLPGLDPAAESGEPAAPNPS